MVLGDSMDPAKRVVIHTAEQIPERMVDDADPERPWVKGKRRMAPAQTVDRYFKCSVLPAGSFEEAKATEVRAAAREARRNDPSAGTPSSAGYGWPGLGSAGCTATRCHPPSSGWRSWADDGLGSGATIDRR